MTTAGRWFAIVALGLVISRAPGGEIRDDARALESAGWIAARVFEAAGIVAPPKGESARPDRLWRAERNADLSFRGAMASAYSGYIELDDSGAGGNEPIVDLCRCLESEPAATYESRVERAIDIEEWIRFFAVSALVADAEPGIATTAGRNCLLRRRRSDERFLILPDRLDRTFEQPCLPLTAPQLPVVNAFLSYPEHAIQYRAEVRRLLDEVFTNERIDGWLAELAPRADAAAVERLRRFHRARVGELRAQLRDDMTAVIFGPRPEYLISPSLSWKVFSPGRTDLVVPPNDWTGLDFSDTASAGWTDASMPWGFAPSGLVGFRPRGTFVPPEDLPAGTTVFWGRRRFDWNQVKPPARLRLGVRAEGAGWTAWVNGREAARRERGRSDEARPYEFVDLSGAREAIRSGENVLAIRADRGADDDSPLVLDAMLLAEDVAPGDIVLGKGRVKIGGRAPVPPADRVRLGGASFHVDPWKARWEADIELMPGWNTLTFVAQTRSGETATSVTRAIYFAERATVAPPEIKADTTWTRAQSPYRIKEDLAVGQGATLRVEAGVVVAVDPFARVVCAGTLEAEGAPGNPVVFFATDRYAGWPGISNPQGTGAVHLRGADLRDVTTGR